MQSLIVRFGSANLEKSELSQKCCVVHPRYRQDGLALNHDDVKK